MESLRVDYGRCAWYQSISIAICRETTLSSKRRSVRIDVSRDLPARAHAAAPEALAQVFGGACKGEWIACSTNLECCSNKCRRAWYINGVWTYECLPTWATTP